MRDAERPRDPCAVAPVPVEELNDSGRLAERADALESTVPGDRVDHPDAPTGRDRV